MIFLLEATETTATAAGGATMGDTLIMVALCAAAFLVMYFVLIRPQRKRDKELQKQVSALCVGDNIVTIGGVVGVVANIQDDNITITTSVAHTMLTFKKTAISTIVKKESAD